MAATLHVLHPQSQPIAGFLRIGHTGQRKLGDIHASGRFPYKRVVFDAAHIDEQIALLKLLKSSGCEIILDPNFAEMAAIGRFSSSSISKLPWANADRPWSSTDFGRNRNLDTGKAIAEFAVKRGVSVVLAPSHFVEEGNCLWQSVDLALCETLRAELDRCGGNEISIDYQIITTSGYLIDERARVGLIFDMRNLPVENVWIRASGFGANATGAGTRHFIEAVRGLHEMGKPLVADTAGGLAGLAAAAFGAVGGISHGVGQKESFKVSDWAKRSSKGGSPTRIYVKELDRYLTEDQISAVFTTKGGRSCLACNDTSCCSRGGEDMIGSSQAHFLTQRSRQIDSISRVPESRRSDNFLLHHVNPALRTARQAANLKISDEKVLKYVCEAKKRLLRLGDALADLQASAEQTTRSRSPTFRGGVSLTSTVIGI